MTVDHRSVTSARKKNSQIHAVKFNETEDCGSIDPGS